MDFEAHDRRVIDDLENRIAALEAKLAELAAENERLRQAVNDTEIVLKHAQAERDHLGECLEDALEQKYLAITGAPKVTEVRPLDDWHEDHGHVVWWTWKDGEWLGEPSYIGSPLCDDWSDYHTHWSPHPPFPAALNAAQDE